MIPHDKAGASTNQGGGKRRAGIRSSPSPNHNIIRNPRLKRRSYALRLLTRGASAGGIGAETLGFCAMRKARRRCMFLITAACRSTSSFIASAISASRRSIRDAKVSFGSFFSDSGCFASSIIGRPCTRYPVISIQSPDCECSIRVGSIVALAFSRFQPSA